MKTLTKAELMRHMADNTEKGLQDNYGLQRLMGSGVWVESIASSASVIIEAFEQGAEYRKAPKTHTVNGYEVPAPETEEPNIGDCYFISLPDAKKWTDEQVWNGDEVDLRCLERDLVHLSDDSAVANAKAMAKVDPHAD